ncbi:MAG: KH domain-containing protein [Alphaproteobacteria bacterium]
MLEEESKLRWPTIGGDERILAEKLKKRGLSVVQHGRSGFSVRNSYEILHSNGILTQKTLAEVDVILKEEFFNTVTGKLEAFDKYFDKDNSDLNKVYSLVQTGADFDLYRIMDSDKYETIASIRISKTKDSRQGIDHTYLDLVIHKERLLKDKRKIIKFEVPKKMIGKIIGKNGSNIKDYTQRYDKHFKVEQIESEKIQEIVNKKSKEFFKNQDNNLETALAYFNNLSIDVTEYTSISSVGKEALKSFLNELLKKKISTIKYFIKEEEERKERDRKTEIDTFIKAFHTQLEDTFLNITDTDLEKFFDEYILSSGNSVNLSKKTISEIKITMKKEKNAEKKRLEREKQNKIEKIHSDIDGFINNFYKQNHKFCQKKEITRFVEKYFKNNDLNSFYGSNDNDSIENITQNHYDAYKKQIETFKKNLKKLRKIYHSVVWDEITNVNGEIHRKAGDSKASKGRIFSAVNLEAKNLVFPTNWYDVDIIKEDYHGGCYLDNAGFVEEECQFTS